MVVTLKPSQDFSNTSISELAAIVAKHLSSKGIDVVLVGGLAVEIYTENLYLTQDIDMVDTSYQSPTDMQKAMAELGFYKPDRVYVHDTTPICVEFPSGPLTVGDEIVKDVTAVETPSGLVPIMRVEDVVKDRLAAYMHWQDNQSLIQAVAVMLKHQLLPGVFSGYCLREGDEQQLQMLEQLYEVAKDEGLATMEQLESMLTKLLLNRL